MKIAYIIEVMYNSGGMERVLSVCANSLCQDLDVSIVTLYQKGRPTYFPLDNRIHCYDLGLEGVANRTLLKERLTEFLMSHHFDIVITMGGMDMYYLHSIKDGSKKIAWLHFAHNIAYTAWLGDSPSLFRKAKGYLLHVKRIMHARRYEKIVTISNSDYQAWEKYTHKAILIYNPVTINTPTLSDLSSKRVISVGRLDYQKGYDLLIDVWKNVNTKYPDWKLDIYGDGSLKDEIQKKINDLYLSKSITLCGRTHNIAEEYASHSIFVMTSRTEALGLVLIEAASCGLPLIAFDCPSGPRDIITDGKNGFLIPKVGDVETMAEKICQLIENDNLRKQMGENAKILVDKYSPSKIKEEWMKLFYEIVKNS